MKGKFKPPINDDKDSKTARDFMIITIFIGLMIVIGLILFGVI